MLKIIFALIAHMIINTLHIITGDDPVALVGVGENCNVPVLTGDDANLAVQDAVQARLDADNAMDIDRTASPSEATPLKLVVIDGMVMDPTHCAFGDCTQDLAKLKGGILCVHHELLYGNLCHMGDYNSLKVAPTHICAQHQDHWYKHAVRYGCQHYLDFAGW